MLSIFKLNTIRWRGGFHLPKNGGLKRGVYSQDTMYACTGQRFQLRSKSIFMTSKWPPASNHGNLEMPEIGFDLLKTEQTCHPTYDAFGLRQSFVVDAKENRYVHTKHLPIRSTHWAHCCLWYLVTKKKNLTKWISLC